MKVQSVTVMQRRNMGNYEHLEITLSAQLDESMDASVQILHLRAMVEDALNNKATFMAAQKEEVKEEPKKEEPKKEAVKEEVKEAPKKEKKTKKPSKKDDWAEATQEELPIEEVKEEPKKPAKAEKAIPYDRDNEGHKGKLSSYLNANFPKWKVFANYDERNKTVAFTQSLGGQPFLTKEGEIVESFKETLSGFFA